MPLIRLARHIFSLCANSASCERLFSAFSNILTKVRNRTGKETLQTLAEIKLHVRDEHLAHTEMKTRLKRRFGTVDLSFATPPSSSSTQPNDITEASQIPMTSSIPSTSNSSNEAAESNIENAHMDDQSAQFLSTIIDQFIQQGELDVLEPEDFVPITSMAQCATISLEGLFDFSRDYWITHHQRTGRRSLDEELEVYNLLDADLPGEEGAEVAIDDTTADILTLNYETCYDVICV